MTEGGPLSPTERQRRRRADLVASGLAEVTVTIPARMQPALVDWAKRARGDNSGDGPPPPPIEIAIATTAAGAAAARLDSAGASAEALRLLNMAVDILRLASTEEHLARLARRLELTRDDVTSPPAKDGNSTIWAPAEAGCSNRAPARPGRP